MPTNFNKIVSLDLLILTPIRYILKFWIFFVYFLFFFVAKLLPLIHNWALLSCALLSSPISIPVSD